MFFLQKIFLLCLRAHFRNLSKSHNCPSNTQNEDNIFEFHDVEIPGLVEEFLNLIELLSIDLILRSQIYNFVGNMLLFFASWAASTAHVESFFNFRFVVNYSWWHDHYYEEKVYWNQDSSKDSKCSYRHDRAHDIRKECGCRCTGCNCHSSNSSPERVSHSFP